MRHHDSYYVIHYITVHHPESYLDSTDITAPRPPVWPYSYVSVDHAAFRRYGRYHNRRTQSLRKCYHSSHTYRGLIGVLTKVRLLGTPINERTCRRKNHHRPSETSPGQGSDQSLGWSTTEGEMGSWRQSLAGRQESETPLSKPETSPKTVWAIQNRSSHIPSGVSIGPSPIMDNTQRFPRRSFVSVQRNETIRSQLPETSPRRH